MRLKEKVAVITGAGSGIGRASSLKFAQEGARVIVADVNIESGQETVNIIRQQGGDAQFYQVNVTSFEEIEKLVHYTVEQYGTIDIMFNNAGVGHYKPLLEHDPAEDFDKILQINTFGVYYGILAAARKMVELGVKGSIINTASVYAYMASEGVFAYHASKGSVVSMTQTAALELAPHGIQVTGIAPGRVKTPILEGYKEIGLWEILPREQMRKTFTEPEEIANVAAFLASEESNAVNGSIIMADDGFTQFKMHLS
ncbi:SDR family NAD(P)-dependent oxidoreductase [Lysinibacillus sp. LZ02]|uniref:SDR family NAD(P)-dependent oxidoreductase n=1 Tax=Lysinibacillus sp. LZ02 TaxID=3420668 RepID=UPI003D35F47D